MTEQPDPRDARVVACMNLIAATGAESIEIRHSDEEDGEPLTWVAISKHGDHFTARGGLSPLEAMYFLVESIIDGGECTNCHRGCGVSDSWEGVEMPGEHMICWWKYDPDLKQFLRGCDNKVAGSKA